MILLTKLGLKHRLQRMNNEKQCMNHLTVTEHCDQNLNEIYDGC